MFKNSFCSVPHVFVIIGGTQRLPRLVGIGKAKELIFTAKVITGEEAADIGLVEHSVPQNEKSDAAYEKALEIAKEIAENYPLPHVPNLSEMDNSV